MEANLGMDQNYCTLWMDKDGWCPSSSIGTQILTYTPLVFDHILVSW
jgi:hypothetical protein